MSLDDVFLLSQREGFGITSQDWKDYMQEKLRLASTQLNDSELERVSAAGRPGFDPFQFTNPPICCLIGC